MDRIGDWSQADLRRFIVNSVLTDPGALPRQEEDPVLGKYLGRFDPSTWASGVAGARNMDVADLLADATNGVVWRFLYNAASSSAYKWEFVGGAPMYSKVDADQSTSSTTYVDLSTVGPSITLPRDGDYMLSFGARFGGPGTSAYKHASPSVSGSTPNDTDSIFLYGTNDDTTPARTHPQTGITGSRVVKLQYKSSAGVADTFGHRWLSIVPTRIA